MALMKDLNALQVFLVLMQTHSTQRTAAKIGRSQSYVSKVLAQLRDELEDPLFIRSAEGLSPTSYALGIEPKLRNAFEQVNQALSPEEFTPYQVDKITLHIIEPYIAAIGKPIIQAIRKESDAIIEIKTWGKLSSAMIDNGEVDIGLHILGDKPQTLYQKRVHGGAAFFDGNRNGEYVKYVISEVNDYRSHYKVIDPSIEATLIVDNYELMKSLLDDCFTLRYRPFIEHEDNIELELDVALVMKSTQRQSPKIQWLMGLIEPVVLDYIKHWNAHGEYCNSPRYSSYP